MDAIARPEHTCTRCGHTWFSRTYDRPARCTLCKSPHWQGGAPCFGDELDSPGVVEQVGPADAPAQSRQPIKCTRCDHEWLPRRSKTRPTYCPKCHSTHYAEPVTPSDATSRVCPICNEVRPYPDGFSVHRAYQDGRNRKCKVCCGRSDRQRVRVRPPKGRRGERAEFRREQQVAARNDERDRVWTEAAFDQLRANREAVRG
jgi:predicted Zn-ribbon and HTH transcriptional regulator